MHLLSHACTHIIIDCVSILSLLHAVYVLVVFPPSLQGMVGGLRDWKRLWCVMRQNHLRCWSCPEDVGKKMPLDTIDLTQGMVVESASRLSMRRPNSVLLSDDSVELFVAFESKEERAHWMDIMNQVRTVSV